MQVEDACRAFATPFEGDFAGLADLVATAHGKALVDHFLSVRGNGLAHDFPALASVLTTMADRYLDYELTWDTSFGDLATLLRAPENGRYHVATSLALRLVALREVASHWSGPVSSTSRELFGRWLLPAADSIEAQTDGRSALLSIVRGGEKKSVELTHIDGDWQMEHGEAVPRLPRCGILVITPKALPLLATAALQPGVVPTPSQIMVQCCVEAVDLLEAHCQPYATWVSKTVRKILPLAAEEGRTRSGSRSEYPGLVHMSLPVRPIAVADMLVHEASHQYYHLACRIQKADTGEDQRLYYSPAVGRERPLSRILLAFHAFGNMGLLYELAIAAGVADGGYCAKKQAELKPQLRQLWEPLDGNGALTPVGRALVDPLADRLRQLNVL